MAAIHILTGSGNGVYTAIIHTATPAGNNVAGVAWSTALVNSGRNTTAMATGTGPGQITAAEAAQIAAGTVFEASIQWQNNPAWNNAQRAADLDLRAQQAGTEKQAELATILRLFGATRG